MGITIESKRCSCDLGYGGFNRFRTMVAKLVNEEVSEHYAKLMNPDVMYLRDSERVDFFKEYDAKTLELIEDGKLTPEIANFLLQSDCDGKINRKQAKMVYELIKSCDDDIAYGYSGRADCARMSDMKRIFSDGTKVEWR